MIPEIRVGLTEGDLCGADHRVVQAAVDYLAGLGGGVAHIGPGTWMLRDSIRLRSGVSLIGSGPETVLRKASGGASALAEDGDYGDRRILPQDSSDFAVGDGVTVYSGHGGGFYSAVATVVGKDEDGALILDQLLNSDLMVSDGASVSRACPLLRATDQENIAIADLVLDGNRDECPPEDGCRGGGINFLRVGHVQISRVVCRKVNGDGFSYQNSPDVTVEDCVFEDNAGGGCHPGSGSARPIVRRSTMRRNDGCGLFLCWRVQHGLFEDNVIEGNAQMGISLGHKDTDNEFRRNEVRRNGLSGVYFRDEAEHAAAHRCLVADCVIEDNGKAGEHNGWPSAGIRLDGETHDTVLRGNVVRGQDVAILIGKRVGAVTIEGTFAGQLRDLRQPRY
jgi:hypothetical protein